MRRPGDIPHLDAVYKLLADANDEAAESARDRRDFYIATVLDNTARDFRARAEAERKSGAA